jgi:Ca-activated chloride channel homolog
VPYPKEYTDLIQDRDKLQHAAQTAGGQLDPTELRLFSPDGQKVRYYRDLWPWVIYGLLGLFLIDLLLRRVRIFGYGPAH